MKDVSHNDGRTILFVSHNLAAISTLCDRAILLNNGKMEMNASVDEVLHSYITSKKVESNGRVTFNGNEAERFGEKKYAEWKSLSLKNKKNQVTDIFVMGEKMKIEIEADVRTCSDDFEIGIGIANLQEVSLHYLLANWEGVSSIKSLGKNLIQVELPQINLFPGNYMLNIWIALRGAYYDDAIHNAISFKVDEGKVNEHDTYFQRFSKNTQVYTPSAWKISKI